MHVCVTTRLVHSQVTNRRSVSDQQQTQILCRFQVPTGCRPFVSRVPSCDANLRQSKTYIRHGKCLAFGEYYMIVVVLNAITLYKKAVRIFELHTMDNLNTTAVVPIQANFGYIYELIFGLIRTKTRRPIRGPLRRLYTGHSQSENCDIFFNLGHRNKLPHVEKNNPIPWYTIHLPAPTLPTNAHSPPPSPYPAAPPLPAAQLPQPPTLDHQPER